MKRQILYKAIIAGVFFLPLIPLYLTHYPQHWLAPALEKFCDQSFTGLKCRLQAGEIAWAGWRHPFSGKLSVLEFQYDEGTLTLHDVLFSGPVPLLQPRGKITLQSAQMQIHSPKFFSKSLTLKNLHADLLIEPGKFILKDLHFKLDEADGQIRGELSQRQEEEWQLTLWAQTMQMALEKLSERWPIPLATKSRQWVLKNIPKGTVSQAHIEMRATLSPTAFKLEDVGGQIEAHGVEVHYLGDLPAVRHVKGMATYTTKDFRIRILEGRVWGIQLPEGQIDITGLDQEDQHINIDLKLDGSIGAALKIIDPKPLRFAQKINLSPGQITDEAATNLHLDFLLETDTALKDIQVLVQSHLMETKLDTHKTLGDQTLWLTAKRLNLLVDKDHFVVQGTAKLNQWQGDLWREEVFQEDRYSFF